MTRSALIPAKRNAGQAMTEFVVSVAFIFMVLFVVVPLFGKIIDMKMTNLQASRYAAWERTVWLQSNNAWNDSGTDNSGDFVISSDEFESVAVRSDDDLLNTLQNRFYNGQGRGEIRPIDSSDALGVSGDTSPVWTYPQSKRSMFGDVQLEIAEEETDSIAYDVIDALKSVTNPVASALGTLTSALGGSNEDLLSFDYNLKGYYSPTLTTSLNTANAKGGGNGEWDRTGGNWGSGIEDAIFQRWDGEFVSNSAILADGWNAQSVGYYKDRVDNYVPSTVFDNALFDAIIDILSCLEGCFANSAIDKLDFGDIEVNPMPFDEDSGAPLDISEDGGFYYYD
ncbi:hypothetical protein QWI17_05750 [Gilvimarinus sp. SDUM040013]|uniref:Flp pilus-assembly TadG-like N-terminal domain-containing protein n=1 Tax=Gilvimarinus gilvus TaxID=3058038 RepID=A0ABU4S6E9_9GAMM|nr:hypothetical protein [Gilvimarinus sp. SDUM040013]MDO3385342.1 hypothetical protein [Gilvimarinus sp. SDUM040013]MDX6851483.1 hypothetical protein [Gilvimarinus sp. SDUM040013]